MHKNSFHGGLEESLVRITTAFVVPVRSSAAYEGRAQDSQPFFAVWYTALVSNWLNW